MCRMLRNLPRSGWPFGRAGLGAKATYPVITICLIPQRVGVGPFLLVSLYRVVLKMGAAQQNNSRKVCILSFNTFYLCNTI